ncbi:MAG: hypothetical protein ACI9AR_000192 [Flavobacteriaceae bacterium]|jgi:hypothetical protein
MKKIIAIVVLFCGITTHAQDTIVTHESDTSYMTHDDTLRVRYVINSKSHTIQYDNDTDSVRVNDGVYSKITTYRDVVISDTTTYRKKLTFEQNDSLDKGLVPFINIKTDHEDILNANIFSFRKYIKNEKYTKDLSVPLITIEEDGTEVSLIKIFILLLLLSACSLLYDLRKYLGHTLVISGSIIFLIFVMITLPNQPQDGVVSQWLYSGYMLICLGFGVVIFLFGNFLIRKNKKQLKAKKTNEEEARLLSN